MHEYYLVYTQKKRKDEFEEVKGKCKHRKKEEKQKECRKKTLHNNARMEMTQL